MVEPRENSSIVYDEANGRVLIFGGWSGKYMNDMFEINVNAITGPPYAIYGIEPQLGPITGNTLCVITGEGFVPNRSYVVEFNTGKYQPTSGARYVSPTQIECQTPDFVSFGPREVSVRVRAEKGDLTMTDVPFRFFLNTQSSKTIAFGPGLLEGNKSGAQTCFFIQSRNSKNENRTSGRDKFSIDLFIEREETVTNEEGETSKIIVKQAIDYEIHDYDNGQYKVSYTNDQEGEAKVDVFYIAENGKKDRIRGGPFKATFGNDFPEVNNSFTGPLMQEYLASRLKNIKTFIKQTSHGIDTSDGKFKTDRKALLKIKENTSRVQENKEKNILDLEVIEQTLLNLEASGKDIKEQNNSTKKMILDMQKLEGDCLETEKKISNNIKDDKLQCRNELIEFEKTLKKYYLSLKELDIYNNFNISIKTAFEILKKI